MKHEAERKITKSKTITVARALADLANLTNKSYIILNVDHDSSNSLRIANEFERFGREAIDAILEDNSTVIEYADSDAAMEAFELLDIEFPTTTPTTIVATLIRPFKPVAEFTQTPGIGRLSCEAFASFHN